MLIVGIWAFKWLLNQWVVVNDLVRNKLMCLYFLNVFIIGMKGIPLISKEGCVQETVSGALGILFKRSVLSGGSWLALDICTISQSIAWKQKFCMSERVWRPGWAEVAVDILWRNTCRTGLLYYRERYSKERELRPGRKCLCISDKGHARMVHTCKKNSRCNHHGSTMQMWRM